MTFESPNKIIHCVCPLSADGIPKPYSPLYTAEAALPPSPPVTPNHLLPKRQTVPLTVYSPSKDTFHIHSQPTWHMIHATTGLLTPVGFNQSICIDSRPLKHPSTDRDLHAYITNVLDPLFQESPAPGKHACASSNLNIETMWRNYNDINAAYAEEISKQYNNGDLVWIHDYQLLMVPHYLRQMISNVKIGLSIYSKFPYWEHLSSVHGNKNILESMLQADHIGFQTKLDARHFATTCTQFLSMSTPPSSKQIGVFSSGIESDLLIKASVLERAQSIRDLFPDKQIIFCRDTHVASVLRTLAAFSQVLAQDPYLRKSLVLLHVCSTIVPSQDLKAVPELVRQINQLYGDTDGVPVHFYHQELDREEQEAIMAASDLGLFLGSHPSNLTAAKEFVICQRKRRAPLVLSQTSPLANVKEGAIMTLEDPSNVPGLTVALHDALTMCFIDSKKRHDVLYNFIVENNAKTCAQRFIQFMIDHQTLPLYTQQLIQAHRVSKKNLVILCDDDTVGLASEGNLRRGSSNAASNSFPKTQSSLIHSYLDELGKDHSNAVYIVTGKDKSTINSSVLANDRYVGFSAEYGAFIKSPHTTTWSSTAHDCRSSTQLQDNWKEPILCLFNKYVQHMLGASIDNTKETTISLDFQKVFDIDNASIQLERCYEELVEFVKQSRLVKLKVFKSQAKIDVQRHYHDDRHNAFLLIETLMATVQPEVVICISADRHRRHDDPLKTAFEEAMFSTLYYYYRPSPDGVDQRNRLYTIVVPTPKRLKPTMANWYLKDPSQDVTGLLKGLALAKN
ncbi:MAG: glycosyltransferase family 20-domain-containing protein [Benjaminiella poitrasii]|nr:MAG: glycosyltransferase family 20-domain-containing protein [Benjaminiella poitrasii]